ncbi:hypothetical protein PRUPE_1G321400 [Prunus persica]|uniref:Tetratricopeptide repeat protein 5 OB fold domain-containing protein n=1 Tax=Prunus persica TaxID=3760 RepID=A0A251R6D9_PRUPE|nr:hypothetical protein PRUPE_1G321400 [Prunus persica]
MSSQAVEDDALVKATRATEALYLVRDTYFPPNPDDKIAKLNAESDLALSLLDSIPPEQRKLPAQRAKYEYLRGKILDVLPDYRKEAEDHLSKAGPNKQILCQLSMLERKMAQGTDNQAELVDESIQHAKEAITLDVKDGNSWYNLGNACLTSFFVTGAWDHAKLLKSLKAYQNAEKDERMKSNPDLYFNSATVNKYLENYERALTGFEAAALKDPGLSAMEEVQKIVNLLDKLDNLLRGHARSKRLASLASSLTAVNLNSSYRRATVDLLSEGLNKAVALIGKVLFFIKHENVAPLYYLACDANQICFVVSVYGIQYDLIKEGDQLTILDPFHRHVNFSWKEKLYQFKSFRVDFIEQMLVNGKALTPHQAVRTSIYAQHKP